MYLFLRLVWEKRQDLFSLDMQHAEELSVNLLQVAPLQSAQKQLKEQVLQALSNGDGSAINCNGHVFELITKRANGSWNQGSIRNLLIEFMEQTDSFEVDDFMAFAKEQLKAQGKEKTRLKISKG